MHESSVLPAINWWTMYGHAPPMGWFLLDFILFVGLLAWASRRPLAQAFRARHASIRQAVSDAAAAHARASQEQQDARAKLLALETEIAQLFSMNEKDGQQERARAIEEAAAYGLTLRQDSRAVADHEMKRARNRLRAQLVQGIVNDAQRLLAEHMKTSSDQAKLIDRAIARLEQERPMAQMSAEPSLQAGVSP